ncbi:elongation factor P [Spiroplasma endosymbiont of Amphibalanus improvisus]|uniref:elongation factor P n=1 Tax=Spiroplasma endosymbiont of Amphibalanus improvisus TaxID=3066327 RepID=UPI00313D13EF
MINVNDLKPGLTIEFDNNIYIVIDAQHSKTGRAQSHVKTKIKNLRNNAIITFTFTGGQKVKKAIIDKKEMQYLYSEKDEVFFMDNETYEQMSLSTNKIKWEQKFLKEGLNVTIQIFDGELLNIVLPEKISLKITECEEAIKGDTTSTALKKAILETGLEVMVPLFITNGENILVSTSDGKYSKRG